MNYEGNHGYFERDASIDIDQTIEIDCSVISGMNIKMNAQTSISIGWGSSV